MSPSTAPSPAVDFDLSPSWMSVRVHSPGLEARLAGELRAQRDREPGGDPALWDRLVVSSGGALRDMAVSRLRDPEAYAVGVYVPSPSEFPLVLATMEVVVRPATGEDPSDAFMGLLRWLDRGGASADGVPQVSVGSSRTSLLATRVETFHDGARSVRQVSVWAHQPGSGVLVGLVFVTESLGEAHDARMVREFERIGASVVVR